MKKIILLNIFILWLVVAINAQPTFSTEPRVFTAEDEVTLTVDVSGTSLEGHAGSVFIWAWIAEGCSSDCDAPSNVDNPSGEVAEDAQMNRSESNPNIYTKTFVPQDFFSKSPAELVRIGFKLKSAAWSDGKQTDNDAFLSVAPLTFTPVVNRVFPNKATADDVITLYLDQKLSDAPEVKYAMGNFTVEARAFNEAGEQVGDVFSSDIQNEGNGLHQVRMIPSFSIPNADGDIATIKYAFISKSNPSVKTQEFELILLDLK